MSSLEERKELRRNNCYTFKELYDFFSSFYKISTRCDNSIIDKREWNLYNSDIEFTLKSYGEEKIVTDFFAMTWSGGWSHKRKAIHLEWLAYDEISKERYKGEYAWYKVDYSKGEYIKVDNFLLEIVNFIIQNDEDHYEKPYCLKRELKLKQLLEL
jgi:hypothetical protein